MPFQVQEPLFFVLTRTPTPKRTVGLDNAVAGDNDQERIAAIRLTYSHSSSRILNSASDDSMTSSFTVGVSAKACQNRS